MPRRVPPKGERPPSNRQSVLTDELQTNVIRFIRAGNLVETAAQANGITKETLYQWLREGAKARQRSGKLTAREARCLAFSDAVMQAQGEADAADIAAIGAAGRMSRRKITTTKADSAGNTETTTREEEVLGDWRARLALVERRNRRYNIRLSAEVGGDQAEDLETELGGDKVVEIKARIAGMRERMADAEGSDEDGTGTED